MPFCPFRFRSVDGHFVFFMPLLIHNLSILHVLTNNYVCVNIFVNLRCLPEKQTGGANGPAQSSSSHRDENVFQHDDRDRHQHGVTRRDIPRALTHRRVM